jgi:hypothetical protein
MIATITGMFLTSFLTIIGKVVTQSFFEAVLKKVIIHAGRKLAPMTSNTLDDELVTEIEKRLE